MVAVKRDGNTFGGLGVTIPSELGDVDWVARGFAVPREAVETAIVDYREHQAAIDARIEANVSAVA